MIGTTLSYNGMVSLELFLIADQAPDRGEQKSYVDFLKERATAHGKARLLEITGRAIESAYHFASATPDELEWLRRTLTTMRSATSTPRTESR